MKKTVKIIIVVSLCVCMFWGVNGFMKNNNDHIIDLSEYPVEYIHASAPAFDITDKSLCVGFSDNTFVAEVTEVYYGGVYNDNYYGSEDAFIPKNSLPCTKYEVTIFENIKGNFKKGELITIYKLAGITKEKKLNIIQGDIMPVKGEMYVFLTKTDENGSFLIVDPNGNVPLTEKGYNIIDERENVVVSNECVSTTVIEKEEIPTAVSTVTPDGRVVTTQVYDLSDESDSFRYYSKNMTKEEVIESYREAFKTQRNPIEELKK